MRTTPCGAAPMMTVIVALACQEYTEGLAMLCTRPSRRFLARSSISALGAFAAMAGTITLAAPAWSGTPNVPVPAFVLPALPTTWSALGSGTLVSPDAAASTTAIAGTDVKAQIGTVDFTGTAGAGTYSYSWLSCSSRGAADGACTTVESATAQSGNPSGLVRTYVPKTDDVGRYLRFTLTVVPSGAGDTSRTVTTDPTKDVYVLGQTPTGAQPEVKSGQTPGENGTAILKKWTIPASSNFRIREVAVWACTSSTAGQTTTKDFAPSSAGCTSLTVLTSVSSVADQTAIVFGIPSDATGKYLLVVDTVTTATGPSSVLASYAVRSAAVGLKGAAAGSASPTPSPSATATPSPSPTTNVTPTMTVVAVKGAAAGKPYSVTVTVSPSTATGIANVRLVTRTAKAKTVQTLTSVQLANGTGTSQTKITAKPGKYALIVQFVDSKTGKTLTYSRKVRVRA